MRQGSSPAWSGSASGSASGGKRRRRATTSAAYVRELVSLRKGVGTEPGEGFFDADSELNREHPAGLVDLRQRLPIR